MPSRGAAPAKGYLLICSALACGRSADSTAPVLVTRVHQFGPVGYRDPLGVISPDGRWLVTAAHDQLRVQELPGGATKVLPAGATRVFYFAWHPDGQLVADQPDSTVRWWLYDLAQGTRQPLWPAGTSFRDSAGTTANGSLLRELSWSSDGRRVAGIQLTPDGSRLWIIDSTGQIQTRSSNARLGYPTWLPDGRIACLAFEQNRQRVTLPCGGASPAGLEAKEAYGPMAVSPDGHELYLAMPNDRGFLGLWAWDLSRGAGRLLAAFARDTYAPSVTSDGRILFRDQDYHTEVLVMPAQGGPAVLRTGLQAETPSWDPTGTRLGITYGTWRRVIDDFRYPDIAQNVGIIAAEGAAPATVPDQVVQDSPSEDQGLTWSPNRRWIAFHSHQQGSDDVWLRPADRPAPLTRLTRLGRGAEVGWPRWSPDGKWIVFDGDSVTGDRHRSMLWVIGVDQTTGQITQPAWPVFLKAFTDEVVHAEWLGSSEAIVFSGTDASGRHTIYRVARTGGTPRIIYTYMSTQRVDGFGVSPDGGWVVFAQPVADGRLQLFRVATTPGAHPQQLTGDSTEKTQPSVSPDGRRIAYTAWRYDARFWMLRP